MKEGFFTGLVWILVLVFMMWTNVFLATSLPGDGPDEQFRLVLMDESFQKNDQKQAIQSKSTDLYEKWFNGTVNGTEKKALSVNVLEGIHIIDGKLDIDSPYCWDCNATDRYMKVTVIGSDGNELFSWNRSINMITTMIYFDGSFVVPSAMNVTIEVSLVDVKEWANATFSIKITGAARINSISVPEKVVMNQPFNITINATTLDDTNALLIGIAWENGSLLNFQYYTPRKYRQAKLDPETGLFYMEFGYFEWQLENDSFFPRNGTFYLVVSFYYDWQIMGSVNSSTFTFAVEPDLPIDPNLEAPREVTRGEVFDIKVSPVDPNGFPVVVTSMAWRHVDTGQVGWLKMEKIADNTWAVTIDTEKFNLGNYSYSILMKDNVSWKTNFYESASGWFIIKEGTSISSTGSIPGYTGYIAMVSLLVMGTMMMRMRKRAENR